MLLTISYSESAYPITPVEPLKATLYDHLEFQYILFTIHIFILKTINLHMTNSKLRNSDSAYWICSIQVLL